MVKLKEVIDDPGAEKIYMGKGKLIVIIEIGRGGTNLNATTILFFQSS